MERWIRRVKGVEEARTCATKTKEETWSVLSDKRLMCYQYAEPASVSTCL